MSNLELIVALVPDVGTQHIIGAINRELMSAWHHQDPIDLCGELGGPNSVAHMTLFHMFMHADNLAEAKQRMNIIAEKLGPDFKLEVMMGSIELWWNHWVFWMPKDFVPQTREWSLARGLVMHGDSELEGLPKLRSHDHELPTDIELTALMRTDHQSFGYAFSHMPHITLGYVRDEESFSRFPTKSLMRRCWLTKLVLARRGPRGTVTEILHEVPIGRGR